MTVKHMKSDQVRREFADVLQFVRTGGTVIVEHYNMPIARLVPCEETRYVLRWENLMGNEAWVIACRPYPNSDDEGWDCWVFHPKLTKDAEDAAKAWAAYKLATKGLTVDSWHCDQSGDLIPKFA